ncbi:hypothetical protein [Rhizorhapis sp. SPR117]|uniref:hypothetical protein n=1 Tax=Rhizorhapis sp. SPR117 TaxID=2912611 RepID=UPI001F3613B6|nr:hypothetical protein [Rhizorhapis sp. SPR117]
MLTGRGRLAILGALTALGGCASGNAPQSVYRSEAPPRIELPLPEIQSGDAIAAINRDIGPGETIWHMRAALNVASLSCSGRRQSMIADNYNAMLKNHREAFAVAYEAEQSAYRTRFGRDWQRQNDTHMTRLYTFFTKPMAQGRFCDVAMNVSAKVRAMASWELQTYAPGALAQLERPFLSTVSASR